MLELRDITVRFPKLAALRSVNLDVGEGEIVTVLGPSGSGKSTLLRVVAGLQHPESGGQVKLAGEVVTSAPTNRRGVGLMFQDHALFPHLNVAENVAFGLRMRGMGRREQKERVEEMLTIVGLSGMGKRAIRTLSGGQQQRVALARALAPQPKLLMLDEPFGQLDRSLADRLVGELRQLFLKLGISVLAVTHNHDDAFALADRVVIMNEGVVVQTGAPQSVWERPASAFVAKFLGFANVARGWLAGNVVGTPWGSIPLPGKHLGVEQGTDGEYDVLIRPEGVRIEPGGPLRMTVIERIFRGDHTIVRLKPEHGPTLEAAVFAGQHGLDDDVVRVRIDPHSVLLLSVVQPEMPVLTRHGGES